MSGTQQTSLFLMLWIAVAVAWELYVLWRFDGTATISWVIYTWAKAYPILAAAAGALIGHFFWQFNNHRGCK